MINTYNPFTGKLQKIYQDNNNLGWYVDDTALSTAHPTGTDGQFAIVGSTDTVWVWDSTTSAWVDTDTKGQVSSVFGRTGIVVAVDGDYSKSLITGLKDTDDVIFNKVTTSEVNYSGDLLIKGAKTFIGEIGPSVTIMNYIQAGGLHYESISDLPGNVGWAFGSYTDGTYKPQHGAVMYSQGTVSFADSGDYGIPFIITRIGTSTTTLDNEGVLFYAQQHSSDLSIVRNTAALYTNSVNNTTGILEINSDQLTTGYGIKSNNNATVMAFKASDSTLVCTNLNADLCDGQHLGTTDSPTFNGLTATTVMFASEYDNGNSSTTDTINWANGNKQKSTLTADCTYTFTDPASPCNIILKVVQDATGGWTPTFPATVKWVGGSAPTWSTAAGAIDIVSFYWDGTYYYGQASIGFA